MSDDIFSLLDRPWIPVRRLSGQHDTIRPAEITSRIGEDPVVAIAWSRPDLDAATRELLIGLLATACGVDARDRWRAWVNDPPAPEALEAAFAPLAPAFALDGNGPRFQQDLDPLGDEQVPVSQLLIEAPGGNAVKKNLDHFVHRGGVDTLSRARGGDRPALPADIRSLRRRRTPDIAARWRAVDHVTCAGNGPERGTRLRSGELSG